MSAFVCILQRDGAPVEPSQLRRLARALDGPGSELSTLCRGPLGLAVRHPRRPEARRRHGPLTDAGTGRVAAVVGRFAVLDDPAAAPGAPGRTGGAETALSLPVEDDPGPLATWCGPFTLVVAHPDRGRVRIARDHLGERAVFYHLDRHRLVASSDAAAVLRHPAVPDELDRATAARFLAFRFDSGGRSFFRGIRALPPAHALRVDPDGATVEQYWRFRPGDPAPDRPQEVEAADLLHRLRGAVARSVADLEPGEVALSLSGGLDSTAVAAVAPSGVRAFSWTFESLPEADERPRVEALSRHLDLPVTWVAGDGLHPLCDGFTESHVHAGSPFVNPFAALKGRLYEAARESGCTRVLVGDGGDAVHAARGYWLRDLLADRRPGALGSLATALGRAARGDRVARLALRRLLPLERLPPRLRRAPPWLTPEARRLLAPRQPSPVLPADRRAHRHELTAGHRPAEIESEERHLFARCGVERANPFWSWPLLEAAMRLPAYRLHRDGRSKPLSRLALQGLLPESVVEGERGGLLGGLFLRGLELHRDDIRETVFRRPRSDWQRYVRREWLEPHLAATGGLTFGHTILWRVIGYELWQRKLTGAASGAGR